MTIRIAQLLAAIVAITVVATSCSDGDDSAEDVTTESTEAIDGSDDETADDDTSDDDPADSADSDDGDPDDGGDGGADDDDDEGDNGDTGDGSGAAELPGEEWDGFAAAGDEFAVMGVAHDDVLNVRAIPDASSDVVTTLDPTETGVAATGRARLLPQSIWYEVDVDGSVGWVNASFVGFLGGTDDATSEYVANGSQAVAETMVDLGRAVSAAFASEDPPSRIVQSEAPVVGDLGEITYDVIGLGDDSVAGYRLHIFATPDENGETFSLKSIERSFLCSRGSDGELCT